MKYANFIWLEKTNDCMNKTAVVKYDEIFILPRMRIDELKRKKDKIPKLETFGCFSKAHLRLARSQAFASDTRFLGLCEDL